MKQVKIILSIAMIAMIGVFTACEDDEDPNEIFITERNAPETLAVGDTTELEFSIQSDADLAKIELLKNNDRLDTKEENFKEKTSDIYTYKFTPDTSDAGNTLSFALYVTDEDDLEERYDFEITVEEIEVTGDPIKTYSDKLLGSYEASEGSSFASIDGTIYSWSDASNNSEKIDLVYFYGATNEATIAAPDDSDAESVFDFSNWTTQNSTKFGTTTLTANDFDAIDDDIEIKEEATELTASKVNQLSVDDVIAFETASSSANASKKGLIKINSITTDPDGDPDTSDGTIDITVKVQE